MYEKARSQQGEQASSANGGEPGASADDEEDVVDAEVVEEGR
jgi:hypothetical protein